MNKGISYGASLGIMVALAFALFTQTAPTAHASVPATYKFAYQEQMVQFINSLGIYPFVKADSVSAKYANASKLCDLKGYATVAGYTVRDYSSPWNNRIATWDEHKQEWTTKNAGLAGTPGQFDTLTCTDPYDRPTPTPTPTPTHTPTPTPTPTPSPSPTPTPTPIPNAAPVAIAKIGVNGGTPSASVTVPRGVPVTVHLSSTESFDSNGWNTPNV